MKKGKKMRLKLGKYVPSVVTRFVRGVTEMDKKEWVWLFWCVVGVVLIMSGTKMWQVGVGAVIVSVTYTDMEATIRELGEKLTTMKLQKWLLEEIIKAFEDDDKKKEVVQ